MRFWNVMVSACQVVPGLVLTVSGRTRAWHAFECMNAASVCAPQVLFTLVLGSL